MPRFSTNLSTMFTELPFLERFAAARDAGFQAVEFQFPYETGLDDLKAAIDGIGLPVAVFNHKVGALDQGEPGAAAMPGAEDTFKAYLEETFRYAEALRPMNVNVLAGWPSMEEFTRGACLETLAGNLNLAADAMSGIGVRVITEAVNTFDRPGFLLHSTEQAVDLVEAAGHPNLGIEHDLYHMQIMEGDLVRTVEANLKQIGHIQFADTPGRHEPGTGEINYAYVFEAMDRVGWKGFLGAEYHPRTATDDSLGWLRPYLQP